jgi:calcineurin-like phosphoesterase family protein
MKVQKQINKNINNMLRINLSKGQNIFITSDTHFGHKNICRGVTEWNLERVSNSTTRDFQTLEEMNETILNNINSVVGQDDILLHLGDFSFGGFENIRLFRDRIVCRNIHLITGNHDHHIVKNREGIREIFSSVTDYYTQFELRFPSIRMMGQIDRINLVFCHFPIASWDSMNDGVIHLFGHVHLPPEKKIMSGKSMDVGVDGNDYKPYSLFECLSLLRNHPVAGTALPSDHHTLDVTQK